MRTRTSISRAADARHRSLVRRLVCALWLTSTGAACNGTTSGTDAVESDTVDVDVERSDASEAMSMDTADDDTAAHDVTPGDATLLDTNASDVPMFDATATDASETDTTTDSGTDVVEDYVAGLGAPQPLGPMSLARIKSTRPLFRWSLTTPADGAQVEACRDRAFTVGCVTFAATGTSARAPSDLVRGIWFWRLRATEGGAIGSAVSPTWEFIQGGNSVAAGDGSAGVQCDVNGDGYADAFFGDSAASTASIYFGSPTWFHSVPDQEIVGPIEAADFGDYLGCAGDVNGDGFADLAVASPTSAAVYVYLGSASGLDTTPTVLTGPSGSRFGSRFMIPGDFDGDGFGDFWVDLGGFTFLFSGSSSGLGTTPVRVSAVSIGMDSSDVNGDGFSDLVVTTDSSSPYRAFILYVGSPTGPTPSATMIPIPSGYSLAPSDTGVLADVNGDGFGDLVLPTDISTGGVFLGSASGLTTTAAVTPSAAYALSMPFNAVYLGDPNGDGFDDVMSASQELYVRGSATGLGIASPLVAPIGVRATIPIEVGDFNGDGIDDHIRLLGGTSHDYDVYAGHAGFGDGAMIAGFPTGTRPANSDLVTGLGDVDHDGYDDFGWASTSGMFMYFGGASSLTAPTTSFGPGTGVFDPASTPQQLEALGDINGDGYTDILAYGRVYLGNATRIPTHYAAVSFSTTLSVAPGHAAGDVDRDGYADVVSTMGGTVNLYRGAPSGLAAPVALRPFDLPRSGGGTTPGTAYVAMGVGDVNGDHYADVMAGGNNGGGRVIVLYGGASGITGTSWHVGAGDEYSTFQAAGDLDGDGFGDVIVPAASGPSGFDVYLGGAGGLSPTSTAFIPVTPLETVTPPVATGLIDVNQDGFGDVLGGPNENQVFLGAAAGVSTTPSTWVYPPGPAFGSAGDVNGDGFLDVVFEGTSMVPGIIVCTGREESAVTHITGVP